MCIQRGATKRKEAVEVGREKSEKRNCEKEVETCAKRCGFKYPAQRMKKSFSFGIHV